jgi:DNA polymerase III sliding clamp (beta) subunit (PCNA family)
MNRIETTEALKKASPALANNGIVPALECFLFEEKTITAYNDVLAIQLPCASGVSGIVQGKPLISYLNSLSAEEVKISKKDSNITFFVGKARLKLPISPVEDYPFTFPDDNIPECIELPIDKVFLNALRKASISMGLDPAQPWRLGVTILFAKNKMFLFASNNITVTQVTLDLEAPKELIGTAVVLPPKFVTTLLSLGDEVEYLLLTKEWIQAQNDEGLKIFSRSVQDARPDSYTEIFEGIMTKEIDDKFLVIPEELEEGLGRAMIILDNAMDKFGAMIIENGALKLATKSSIGEARDEMKLKGKHEDIDIRFSPGLLEPGLKHALNFCVIPETAIVLQGNGFVYLVSVVQSLEE